MIVEPRADGTMVEPLIPAALLHEITGAYAARLYGYATPGEARESHSVDLSTLRLLWPALLSNESLTILADSAYPLCDPSWSLVARNRTLIAEIHRRSSMRYFYVFPHFLNLLAVWLHQPHYAPPPTANEWVEVTHCSYNNMHEQANATDRTDRAAAYRSHARHGF